MIDADRHCGIYHILRHPSILSMCMVYVRSKQDFGYNDVDDRVNHYSDSDMKQKDDEMNNNCRLRVCEEDEIVSYDNVMK